MKNILKIAAFASISFSAFCALAATYPTQLAPMEPNFIRNGVNVPEGNRLYQTYLRIRNVNGEYFHCGGAIIDRQWILTAAHCVDEDKEVVDVFAGGSDLGGQNIRRFEPDGSFVHPKYISTIDSNDNVTRIENDIALVRLKVPTNLPALRLASGKVLEEYFLSQNIAIASGWGLLEAVPPTATQIMQQASLKIFSTDCAVGTIASGQICSETEVGNVHKGICNGDSGGPLTIGVGGIDYAIGISSLAGKGCTSYSAFVNVTQYLDWIELTKQSRLKNQREQAAGWGIRANEDCQAPYNHVVTGFGGRLDNHNHRITTMRMQVRAILSDGSLGTAKILRCGIFPEVGMERFVTLPDGYVMTGFAGHSQKNNFVGVTAYGKLYDPNSRSLVGSMIKRHNGTNGTEVDFKPNYSKTAITGFGLRAYKSNFRGYKAFLADFN